MKKTLNIEEMKENAGGAWYDWFWYVPIVGQIAYYATDSAQNDDDDDDS